VDYKTGGGGGGGGDDGDANQNQASNLKEKSQLRIKLAIMNTLMLPATEITGWPEFKVCITGICKAMVSIILLCFSQTPLYVGHA
jgi:hypothetical protein